MNVASLRGVRKTFGTTVALDRLDLDIARGESLGLLGPNGAGKSTAISLLTGLRRPDAGTVTLFDGAPTDPANRLRLGVTPQATALPPTLRPIEVAAFVAAHYPDAEDPGELLERFGLGDVARKNANALSGGQQRRLLVALALVGKPELLLLDEPTTGLDVEARESLWGALRHYREAGGTLLLTTHYLEEIERLSDRVVVIDHGRAVVDGTVDEVRARVAVRTITLRTPDPALLTDLPGAVDVAVLADTKVRIGTTSPEATITQLVRRDIPFTDLEVRQGSLEEAFLAITSTEKEQAA